LVIIAYLALIATVMVFHEPWFDEAQAWLIARDSSYHDILLLRPHYEGHPPLWWLILSIPAKLGVPYEVGLKSIQFLSAALMIILLVLRSPFSPVTVILLPFTYFLCYQYGVISRPYALLTSALFLTAIFWKTRDRHPWRFTGALCLLSLTSTYGLALACGFALAWIAMMLMPGTVGTPTMKASAIRRHVRAAFGPLACLLAVGAATALMVVPAADASAMSDRQSPLIYLKRFALMWTAAPSESMTTSYAKDTIDFFDSMSWSTIAACAVVSLVIWIFLVHVSRVRHNLPVLLIPYAMLSLSATVYIAGHHLGIVFAFLITALWIDLDSRPWSTADIPGWLLPHVEDPRLSRILDPHGYVVRGLAIAIPAMILAPSISWNVGSSMTDIRYDYSGSRAMAAFVSRYQRSGDRWLVTWYHPSPDDSQFGLLTGTRENTRAHSTIVSATNPYFSRNIVECTYRGYTFQSQSLPTKKQSGKEIAACGRGKAPKVIVGSSADYYIRRWGYDVDDYHRYVIGTTWTPWKNGREFSLNVVYARTDLFRTLPSQLANLK
ncbi:ABC transporter permease, partial [uncultured Bifidobacterium sp.]|uniref:ABC transporter permease n=1 Tax=uncultured Bifidobacterium sp. TaxID=165187 RepID=UPI00262259A7